MAHSSRPSISCASDVVAGGAVMRLSSTAKSCFCSGASRCISNDMAPALPLVGRSSASPPLTILPCAILYDVLREGHTRKWVIVTRKSSWRPARPNDRCTSASYRHGTGSVNNHEPFARGSRGERMHSSARAPGGTAKSDVLDLSCADAAI